MAESVVLALDISNLSSKCKGLGESMRVNFEETEQHLALIPEQFGAGDCDVKPSAARKQSKAKQQM